MELGSLLPMNRVFSIRSKSPCVEIIITYQYYLYLTWVTLFRQYQTLHLFNCSAIFYWKYAAQSDSLTYLTLKCQIWSARIYYSHIIAQISHCKKQTAIDRLQCRDYTDGEANVLYLHLWHQDQFFLHNYHISFEKRQTKRKTPMANSQ